MTRSLSRCAALALALLLSACASGREGAPRTSQASQAGDRTAVLLAVNDVYRIEGLEGGEVGGLARLRSLRQELERDHPDLLLIHGGDFLFPSFLSRSFNGEQMVDVMNLLDGDAQGFDRRLLAVVGNHEVEKKGPGDAALLDGRIEQSQWTWLAGNIEFAKGQDGAPVVAASNLVPSALVESGGIRIGIFGVTIPTSGVQYVERFADPVETARSLIADLRRRGAEVVVGVTHLNARDDLRLLETLGQEGPDLVIGGHDHERMACQTGGRRALKADADIRTATVARLTLRRNGQVDVCWEFRPLKGDAPRPDPAVAERVQGWLARHQKLFCDKANAGEDCLAEVYGRTRTVLEAEENKIRGSETSLGDWIADRMVAAFAGCGAQAAFINSGSLRLNQDLAAGSEITRRQVEELFAYPTPLRLLRLDGRTLQQVAGHAAVGWPGAGNWLQVSGFSYSHDTGTGTVSKVQLRTAGGSRAIQPDEEILVVANDYLVDPSGDQDGYTMLNPGQIVEGCAADKTDLKEIVIEALRAAEPRGIGPEVDGRIRQVGAGAQPVCSKNERTCGR